jgi:hypothetical protein
VLILQEGGRMAAIITFSLRRGTTRHRRDESSSLFPPLPD